MSRLVPALVLGGSAGVWHDVLRLEAMIGRQWPGYVVAVNDAGYDWPRRVDVWATMHPEKFPVWEAERRANGYPEGWELAARRKVVDCNGNEFFRIPHIVPWDDGGSSGMLGIMAVQCIWGQRPTVLCGIPMTPTPHYHTRSEGGGGDWPPADKTWASWERNLHRISGWVRSLSFVAGKPGRTAEVLGLPTPEWLGL